MPHAAYIPRTRGPEYYKLKFATARQCITLYKDPQDASTVDATASN